MGMFVYIDVYSSAFALVVMSLDMAFICGASVYVYLYIYIYIYMGVCIFWSMNNWLAVHFAKMSMPSCGFRCAVLQVVELVIFLSDGDIHSFIHFSFTTASNEVLLMSLLFRS